MTFERNSRDFIMTDWCEVTKEIGRPKCGGCVPDLSWPYGKGILLRWKERMFKRSVLILRNATNPTSVASQISNTCAPVELFIDKNNEEREVLSTVSQCCITVAILLALPLSKSTIPCRCIAAYFETKCAAQVTSEIEWIASSFIVIDLHEIFFACDLIWNSTHHYSCQPLF